jgi:hypothetical protein
MVEVCRVLVGVPHDGTAGRSTGATDCNADHPCTLPSNPELCPVTPLQVQRDESRVQLQHCPMQERLCLHP